MALSIAVIGSGMAGLAAAHACRKNGHHVTVFEAHNGHGMDAHALQVDDALVDIPLRVMGPQTWPSVLALAKSVGVGTFRVNAYTSCSWPDGHTWFRSGRLLGLPFVGSARFLNHRAVRIGYGLMQLKKLTRTLANHPDQHSLTLAEVLEQYRLDRLFWRGLLLPLLTTICTCDEQDLLAWPALQLLQVIDGVLHSHYLCRLQGGTSALVNALSQDLPIISGSPVMQLRQQQDGVHITNQRGEGGVFDRVIVATQANQLDFLDDAQFAQERCVLADIRFVPGDLWVHSDTRFMPKERRNWSALNFRMDRHLQKPVFSVWVNPVEQGLQEDGKPVLQTWNPPFEPQAETVLARVSFQRAVVHSGTAFVLQQLDQWHQQPGRRVFYCGSWAHKGIPLLESAVRSAQKVAGVIG